MLGSASLGGPDPARPLDLEASCAGAGLPSYDGLFREMPDVGADFALALTREPAGLPAEAVSLVEAYQRASKADATVRAYTGDAEAFTAWCSRYAFRSLPASPEAVAGFLVAEAEVGRAASTIGRRCAAIRYAHKLARVQDPTDDEAVRAR